MGRDKAALPLAGRSLLAHVIAQLSARCAPIVVSTRPGQALPDQGPDPNPALIRVEDPVADAGPLVGLDLALAALAERGVGQAYLSSCDAAGLSDGHVGFMLERLAAAGPGAVAVVPVDPDGRRHPLAAAVEVAVLRQRTRAALAAGDGRLQALFTGEGVIEIPTAALPDPDALAPCNTPEQWAALQLGRVPPA